MQVSAMPEAPRHEHHDIHVRQVLRVTCAIGVLVLLACGLAWIALRVAGARDFGGATAAGSPRPKLLLPDPRVALDEYQRDKRAELEGYAWEDADHRHARVPVEVAMDVLAARDAKAAAR
jgi:hypothetical protein